jgi:hypothetical protein
MWWREGASRKLRHICCRGHFAECCFIVSGTTVIASLPGLANNFDEQKKQHFAETLSAPHTLGANGPKTSTFSRRIVRAEESTLGVSLNDQAQAPDIPTGNAFGKPTRLRAPDFTESLIDLFVPGGLLQSVLLISMILSPSCLANGFVK